MTVTPIVPTAIALTLCVVSGAADARGFVHAARMWRDDQLIWSELGRSAGGFMLGIGCYWVSVRFMQRLGVMSPEVQTIMWFGATIVGVAMASGRIARWPAADQIVAGVVTIGLAWLLVRNSAPS